MGQEHHRRIYSHHGGPVGVIANNPSFGAGVLDVNASDKAARFIRFL
jgi:acetyl-CoA carboxylase carboxyltransferase component